MKTSNSTMIVCGLLSFFFLIAPATVRAQVATLQTQSGIELKVDNLVSGLNHPWGMAFLPDGRLLVTERNTGNLYFLNTDHTLSKPLEGVPQVRARGQGGLMDVALDPNFKENRYVYLSYAKPGEGGKATTALGRGKLSDGRIVNFEDIFIQKPYVNGSNHFGNRIEFSPDGKYLFFALGERFQFDPAQDLSNHLGTVIRIYPDGTVPKDNPFVGRENAQDEIWSYGHRNIEAMAFQPKTGVLWIGEMGPKGGDELNRIEKGANYGWPVVSWGDHYSGREIPDPPTHPEFKDAVRHWTPVISPSGMVFYQGKMFPEWKHNAFIGGLTHRELVRLVFDGAEVVDEERFKLPARIRDVDAAPDGSIYVLTDRDDGNVWRISRMKGSSD
ncbi:MAG: PQQ-dependent sugar dehydrogenase [Thermodesulfobacteriota bacterium]